MLLALAHPRFSVRLLLGALLPLAIVAALVATAPQAHAATRWQKIQNATGVAVNQLGDPYAYGAAGPDRFDCSGLVYFSARRAGLTGVPRTSRAQASHTRRISKGSMRRGDLMFFYDGGGVYHAAIYLGQKNGKAWMVHSPGSGGRVHRAHPWTSRWFAGTLR